MVSGEFVDKEPEDFLYKDITDRIIGCANNVYHYAGTGFNEPIYNGDTIAGFLGVDNSRQAVDDLFTLNTMATFVHGEIMKCLLVEGNEQMRNLTREMLEDGGIRVMTAENGLAALSILKSGRIKYDFVLMDITMPVMDGIETVRALRTWEIGKGPGVTIIGLTAGGSAESVNDILSAGANACINKPVNMSMLLKILISCMKHQSEKMEKELNATIKIANTDPLTGVKNIVAYTDMVAALSSKIISQNSFAFGIVVCDINDLKKENDSNGHDAGDMYIRNCSKIICDVFDHSLVYRTGGDEFAVVLQGRDYENNASRMVQLRKLAGQASLLPDVASGRASFAAGIALYDPRSDKSVSDTIKRADTEMYKQKKMMKAGR